MLINYGTSPHPLLATHSIQWHWAAGRGCGLVPNKDEMF